MRPWLNFKRPWNSSLNPRLIAAVLAMFFAGKAWLRKPRPVIKRQLNWQNKMAKRHWLKRTGNSSNFILRQRITRTLNQPAGQVIAMAKRNITCPKCGQPFESSTWYRGRRISCPNCKHLVHLRRSLWKKLLVCVLALALLSVLVMAWLIWPMGVQWPDRRPIGVLFLASTYHASATNPRGWFNDRSLDLVGPGGKGRFRTRLMDYADTSVSNLTRIGAQGVIVWDLEGEEYPHKTSFIGDPRLLDQLAPEMAPVADEFFKKFKDAGLKVGVTIRPQQLILDRGLARQTTVFDIKRVLLEKIDYAQAHWGATLFYVDSN